MAAGPKSQEAINYLEKKIGKEPLLDDNEEVIKMALQVFQNVLSVDVAPKDIEVGIDGEGRQADGVGQRHCRQLSDSH